MKLSMLNDIPDPNALSFETIEKWVNAQIAALRSTSFGPDVINSFNSVEFRDTSSHPFGVEADPMWRRFFLATLLADWACYEKPIDRADVARLKYILTSAANTTRVWMCRLPNGAYAPVGYTMWYPIAKLVFDGVLNNPEQIDDRGVFLPARKIAPSNVRYGYVFNISIIPELFDTTCSQQLGLAFKQDMDRLAHVNLMAIAVDPDDSKRLFQLGHFSPVAAVAIEGTNETLYVRHAK